MKYKSSHLGDVSKDFGYWEIFKNHEPTAAQIQTAKRLFTCIIQPIRSRVNHAVKVGEGIRLPKSGYGSSTSEHFWRDYDGAVDISLFDHEERLNIMQWLMNDFSYSIGQCIYYLETTHLHISIAGRKQSEFMVCTSKKNHSYVHVKSADDIVKLDKRLQNNA